MQESAISFYALQAPLKHRVCCFLLSRNILFDEIAAQIVVFLQQGQGFLALAPRNSTCIFMLCVLQRPQCPRWQMQSLGTNSSPAGCFPFQPNSAHKETLPFLPAASAEQNNSWSSHVTTPTILLPDPQAMRWKQPASYSEEERHMHQVRATNASLKSSHEPACDTAMQPVLLPDEFTCHNLHILIKHLANF